jgi:GT2 family glycosyltransferase
MNPLVSLVIVNWNRRDYLLECLNSIKKQDYSPLEVIIVDNHSSDGSPEMITSIFPEYSLIKLPDSSYGACEAFNIGFANSNGDFIGILDNDVELTYDWVSCIIDRFKKEDPATAIISTKVIEPNMPDWYLQSNHLCKERYINTFAGCGSMARAKALHENGYYDEKFFIHANERDLALTLISQGYKILHYPDVITYHKKPFGIHKGNDRLYYLLRNAIWVLVKHYTMKEAILALISQVKGNLQDRKSNTMDSENFIVGTIGIKDAIFREKGGIKTAIRAVFDGLTGAPHYMKYRNSPKNTYSILSDEHE